MKEILLCKYGEIILKGANRRYFEDMLERQLKRKARAHGNFNVYRAQSTLYVEPLDEAADMDGMLAVRHYLDRPRRRMRKVHGEHLRNREAVHPTRAGGQAQLQGGG